MAWFFNDKDLKFEKILSTFEKIKYLLGKKKNYNIPNINIKNNTSIYLPAKTIMLIVFIWSGKVLSTAILGSQPVTSCSVKNKSTMPASRICRDLPPLPSRLHSLSFPLSVASYRSREWGAEPARRNTPARACTYMMMIHVCINSSGWSSKRKIIKIKGSERAEKEVEGERERGEATWLVDPGTQAPFMSISRYTTRSFRCGKELCHAVRYLVTDNED